jgi:tetratricopeptide (TPR) repeat protein
MVDYRKCIELDPKSDVMIEGNPNNYLVYHNMAFILANGSSFPSNINQVVEYLKFSAVLNPGVSTWSSVAYYQSMCGNFQESLEFIQKAIEKDKENQIHPPPLADYHPDDLYYKVSEIFFRCGLYEKAEDFILSSGKISKDVVFFTQTKIAFALGDYEKGLTLVSLLAPMKKWGLSFYSLKIALECNCKGREKSKKELLTELDEYFQSPEINLNCLYYLCSAYSGLGDYVTAVSHLTTALSAPEKLKDETNFSVAQCYALRGWLHHQLGIKDRAEFDIDQTFKTVHQNSHPVWSKWKYLIENKAN